MTIEKSIPIMAGSFILISLALAVWVNKWWLLWTAFVGVNLVQSAITGWCPAEGLLKKLGMKNCCPSPEK